MWRSAGFSAWDLYNREAMYAVQVPLYIQLCMLLCIPSCWEYIGAYLLDNFDMELIREGMRSYRTFERLLEIRSDKLEDYYTRARYHPPIVEGAGEAVEVARVIRNSILGNLAGKAGSAILYVLDPGSLYRVFSSSRGRHSLVWSGFIIIAIYAAEL